MNKKQTCTLLILACLVLLSCSSLQAEQPQKNFLNETQQDRDARMDWWRQDRFGMFIHWGLYAIPAGTYEGVPYQRIGEWIMDTANIPVKDYELLAKQFYPTRFDAEQCVLLAKQAGMKYIVITSKHHDGFCLWDSAITDYDVFDASPFKRDILLELKQACDKHDIKLCFYHSIMDWHHPDAQAPFCPNYNARKESNPNWNLYCENYLKPQLKELITKYDPWVLWFDGEWVMDWTEPQGKELYNYLRNIKPSLIINNRVGKGRSGMQGMSKPDDAGDFGTPEQEIPATGLPGVDWESCMTMNDTWGYKACDHNWKSTETLIRNLIDIASKGGNFLLNIGPDYQGFIPKPTTERLQKIGAWMAVNGSAIYGSSASPYPLPDWGRFTAKPEENLLYVHIFNWPNDQKLTIPQLKQKPVEVYLLADSEKTALTIETSDQNGTTISLPKTAPDTIASVLVLKLK